MPIEQQPFETYRYDEERAKDKREILTMSINREERKQLDEAKKFIQQPKDSTALKQLAWIGIKEVLHDSKTHYILDVVLNNERRNLRTGIPLEKPDYSQM